MPGQKVEEREARSRWRSRGDPLAYDNFHGPLYVPTRIEDGGFFHMRWCGGDDCETKVKDDTKATIRCIPIAGDDDPGACVICGEAAEGVRAVFARAY